MVTFSSSDPDVFSLSLLRSRAVADSLQSVTRRWRVHPILGQPAAAPAGDTPVHRTEQAGDPGDALRSSSCWRRRWGEWVWRADCFTFSSQRCCMKNTGSCIFLTLLIDGILFFSLFVEIYLNNINCISFNMAHVSRALWSIESSVLSGWGHAFCKISLYGRSSLKCIVTLNTGWWLMELFYWKQLSAEENREWNKTGKKEAV